MCSGISPRNRVAPLPSSVMPSRLTDYDHDENFQGGRVGGGSVSIAAGGVINRDRCRCKYPQKSIYMNVFASGAGAGVGAIVLDRRL